MLKAVCKNADQVLIGIGSSNKYNVRNPFTASEVTDMINLCLKKDFDNYQILQIPDFGHIPEFKDGKKWTQEVIKEFGNLQYFVSSNDYVRKLLESRYNLLAPTDLIPTKDLLELKGAEVRYEIARYGKWENLVPSPVKDYLINNNLIERFRQEFGLATLALLSSEYKLNKTENEMEEQLHTFEV